MTFTYAFTHDLWFAIKVIAIAWIGINLLYVGWKIAIYHVRLWRAKRAVRGIIAEFETTRSRRRPEPPLVQTIVEQKRKAWR